MRGHKAMAPAALAAAEPLDDDARVPMKSLRSALRLLTEFMGDGTDYSVGELARSFEAKLVNTNSTGPPQPAA